LSVTSTLFTAGFLSVIAGFILVLLSFSRREKEEGERETRGFGVLFLGPLPIILSSGRGWRLLALLSLFLVFIVFLVFFLPSHLT